MMRHIVIGLAALVGSPCSLASRVDSSEHSRAASGLRHFVRSETSLRGGGLVLSFGPRLRVRLPSRPSGARGRSPQSLAQGRGLAASLHLQATLPKLPLYVKRRACMILCDKASGTEAQSGVCLSECARKAETFEHDEQVQPPEPGQPVEGTKYYEDECTFETGPVADINEIGLPSFDEFDVRHDEVLDYEEMALMAALLCVPEEMVADMFYSLDEDGNMLISQYEWNAMMVEVETETHRHETTASTTTTTQCPKEAFWVNLKDLWLHPSFGSMDTDRDGKLEEYEFTTTLVRLLMYEHPGMMYDKAARSHALQEASDLFVILDKDADHHLSEAEYREAGDNWHQHMEDGLDVA